MKLVTRTRVIAAAFVIAVVAVIAALGAVSKSSPTAAAAPLPFVQWYWTMVVSPSDPNTLVLGTSNGIYRSADGGKTWAAAGPKGFDATSVVQAGSAIYAGGVAAAPNVSPLIRKSAGRTAPDGAPVIVTSTNAGKTWQNLAPNGLPNNTIQAMAVDPAHPTTLYALFNTGGLYSSTDGAHSFQLVTAKVGIAPWALAITKPGQFVSGDMDSGSHLSTNAKAWTKTPFTDASGGRMVMEYAVQPNDVNRVVMTSRGIELSTDGGKTWHSVLHTTNMFGPVAYAPSKPETAYAVGFDRTIWRSDDGGKTWKKLA